MRVTQLRIYSLLLTILATLLTIVAFATNLWYTVSSSSLEGTKLTDTYGLFFYCSNGACISMQRKEGWITGVIACMVAAIALSIFMIIGYVVIILFEKSVKTAGVILLITASLNCAALITYPIKMKVSDEGSIGISYYIACIGMVVYVGAGIFAFATKEERVTPFFDIRT